MNDKANMCFYQSIHENIIRSSFSFFLFNEMISLYILEVTYSTNIAQYKWPNETIVKKPVIIMNDVIERVLKLRILYLISCSSYVPPIGLGASIYD